ncbi:MAG: thioredoxin domain-containing protein [Chthonomonadaceae bacterium]|nr:thioredoxin domain-containing protein [Chthonomonadaceae bacterium]
MPNRLALETSPYLLQHQNNPVDWLPWGDTAFGLALTQDKPIFLSVGYSACHWCHVMERESFENDDIAAILNRDFISIKVDREERPDVDSLYMNAVLMQNGQGGWPMSVWMTPEGKPFFTGTYFPPTDRYGTVAFPKVLIAIAEAWKTNRAELLQQSDEIAAQLKAGNDPSALGMTGMLTESPLDVAYKRFVSLFDATNGGFGSAPKFPQPANLDFLLRYHARTERPEALAMVEKTLQKMSLGGMYDQLGGGFHRYSTDATWLAPHFEKMLYDNAQLAVTLSHAWQVTGNNLYRGFAEETLEYVLREMTSPEGGFYSAQDADSEGVEGKFFVWSRAEIIEALGERDGEMFCAFYDVTEHGNWEETNILHVVRDVPQVARQFGVSVEEAGRAIDAGSKTLLALRENRIKPATDDKILTSWNGLMISAFAECGLIFDRPDFIAAADKCADFLLYHHINENRDLLRTSRAGSAAHTRGFLEDYAFLAHGILRVYEATGDGKWLSAATECCENMIRLFGEGEDGAFYLTSKDATDLIHRPKDLDDNAIPSGNTVALEVLLELSHLTGKDEYQVRVEKTLRRLVPMMEKYPMGFSRLLGVLDAALTSPKEIVFTGDASSPLMAELRRKVYARFLPNAVLVRGDNPDTQTVFSPLLEGRTDASGTPKVYVCENNVCAAPVSDPESLERLLR